MLSVLGPQPGGAADAAKLVTRCGPVERTAGGATLSCDVRASGFAVFEEVKARIKGAAADLDTGFEPFDPSEKGIATAYLIQLLPSNRRATLSQMGDAVTTFADQREGKRRFTAYTFGDDLSLIADSGVSKAEFARQVFAMKPASTTVQLYKAALKAIEGLAKEAGDRKALVILGDGTSDDTGYDHEKVVKAAKDAGVVIHVLGYYDDRAERPKFQKLARLAGETGGYATEVKQGPGKDFTRDIVSSRFVGEVLENGGTAKVALKGPPGAQIVSFTAGLSDGQSVTADEPAEFPAPVPVHDSAGDPGLPDPPKSEGALDWLGENGLLLAVLGGLLGAGAFGYLRYRSPPAAPPAASTAAPETHSSADDLEPPGEPLRDGDAAPVVYGWLETMDGDAARHPLQTTNVRVGRHRDNDICLENDSISRRHAVLHYNAETRRFVITDLGAGNGVVVNKTRYKSRELNDGDMVELGEVRLRFRAEHANPV
jgi:hypothetical protein